MSVQLTGDPDTVASRLESLKVTELSDSVKGISLGAAVRLLVDGYEGERDRRGFHFNLLAVSDDGDYVYLYRPGVGDTGSSQTRVYKVSMPLRVLGVTLRKRRIKYVLERLSQGERSRLPLADPRQH